MRYFFRTAAPAWLTRVAYAHRGLFDHAAGVPENSMAAFDRAAEAGLGIELDVALTRDDEAVVFHDDELPRLTGAAGRIADLTAAEAGRLRLLGTAERIPRLAEVLDFVAGRVPLYVELKNPGRLAGVGALCRRVRGLLAAYRGPHAVCSFDPRALVWFRRHAPGITRGLISSPCGAPSERRAFRLALAAWPVAAPHLASWDLRGLPHPFVTRLRRRGVPVLTWTVRTPADLVKARELADGLVVEGEAAKLAGEGSARPASSRRPARYPT